MIGKYHHEETEQDGRAEDDGAGEGTCKPSPSEEETFAETWPSGRCLSQMELTAGAKAQRQELS